MCGCWNSVSVRLNGQSARSRLRFTILVAGIIQLLWTARLQPTNDIIHSSAGVSNAPIITSSLTSSRMLEAPKYSARIEWDVMPNFTEFKEMPIRQFCKWRGDNENINTKQLVRQAVSTENRWNIIQLQEAQQQLLQQHENMTTLLQLTFDCQRTLKESPYGTGNWVQSMYILRLFVAGTPAPDEMDLAMTCRDLTDNNSITLHQKLVMPWLMGHFSSTQTINMIDHHFGKGVADFQRCTGGWGELPIGWMLPWMRHDLRKMAIALVGVPMDDPTHPAHSWSASQYNVTYNDSPSGSSLSMPHPPLIPNVTLDDAVIHFRCGDIMLSEEKYFRFIKYHEFSSRIDPNRISSIGIVTQPFGGGISSTSNGGADDQARERDQASTERVELCKTVILGFADYLRQKFPPHVRISIHNGPLETVALAYARLVMAKHYAFAWPDSSFSVYPCLASFGKSYHMLPLRSPYKKWFPKNYFLHQIKRFLDVDPLFEWMVIDNEHGLFGIETLHMAQDEPKFGGKDAIVEWFRNETNPKPSFPMLNQFTWREPDIYGLRNTK